MARQANGQMGSPFTTTLEYEDNPEWAARAVEIPSPQSLLDEVRSVVRILAAARTGRPMVLDSSAGRLNPDLLAAMVLGLLPVRLHPVIVLTGCMWNRDPGLAGIIQSWIVRLADRAIARYVVQSTEELTVFAETWHVSPEKLHLCLYFYTIPPADAQDAGSAVSFDIPDDYIFSGGNAKRDYDTLVEVARRLPHRQFVIATKRLADRDDLPPNLIARPVSHAEFVTLLHGAQAVVIPIRNGLTRAVGQQTYLNAMVAGIPTIVSQAYGVGDHITHEETGFVVDGSVESYVETLEWVCNPAHKEELKTLGDAARATVLERFTFQRYTHCILGVLDEALMAQA